MPRAPLTRRCLACRAVLTLVVLAACSEPTSPVCATQIAAEVCATPAQPRGAELVQPNASSGVSVQLPATPLADGRYVLVSRSYACPQGAEAAVPAAARGVLELSGCVLRRTLFVEAQEPALVEVFELGGYVGEGVLALQRRCPADQADTPLAAAYGFDGARLELGPVQPATVMDPSSEAPPAAGCDTLDTWELR